MSSLASSRTAIYSPQPQTHPHTSQPQQAGATSGAATSLTAVHPPPTPSVNTAKHQNGSSNSGGYFGLVVEPGQSTLSINHVSNNWSPSASSIKSTAAISPRPVAMDGLPEPFQRQAQALAFSLHHQNLSNSSEQGYNTSETSGDKHSMTLSSPPSSYSNQNSSAEGDHFEGDSTTSGKASSFFASKPRVASPFSMMAVSSFSRSNDNLSRLSAPTSPIPTGPVRGSLNQRVSDGRATTSPVSSSGIPQDLSMISPEYLCDLLKQHNGDDLLLLDLRTFPQYSVSRIIDAVHLCIPTTLLKRPSFNVTKLSETFANDADKTRFSAWRHAKYIIVYDADSQSTREAVSAVHTVSKFYRENWTGQAYCIKGGFAAFSMAYPEKIDATVVGGVTSPKSLSLSQPPGTKASGMGIGALGGFNCALPPSTSAVNPFFSNIRQNMDLIGGVGEIPIKIPPGMIGGAQTMMPSWLKDIASSNGSKIVSDRFMALEKAEQERMRNALTVQVTYGDAQAQENKNRHALAGVEKGTKNRYNNIWPYDHARVKLKDFPENSCDYINASFINAQHSRKRYIATQGPLPSTFQDFWSVVWEQDVRVIVMLTAESEGGQVKCHQYWTEERYGPLVLTKRSEELVSLEKKEPKSGSKRRSTTGSANGSAAPLPDSNIPHIIVRRFSLCHDNYPFHPIREITQLQYTSWPDFGAPAHPAHILALIEHTDAVIRSSRSQKAINLSSSSLLSPTLVPQSVHDRPAIVHCSAGCGRTGTFCAVDTVIGMLRRQRLFQQFGQSTSGAASDGGSDTESCADADDAEWLSKDDQDLICQVVSDFRDQRLSMVQSLRQYVLCYETVLEWVARQKPTESGKRKA